MPKLSTELHQALHRTLILAATVGMMVFIWNCWRIPAGDLLIVVFAFLSAVRIADIAPAKVRLRVLAGLISASAILQYIVSTTANWHLLNVLGVTAAVFIVLKNLPAGSVYIVLLVGFLAYSAEPGTYKAAMRAVDMLSAGAVVWIISFGAVGKNAAQFDPAGEKLSGKKVFIQSLTVFCALLLYRALSMPQGLWIVLTIIFIYMAGWPGADNTQLVRQRIFSVPAGIMLGGLYSATAVMLDYRLAYLAPLIGAAGFFMLYYRHDFFVFSLFFMFTFTVCTDWLSGTLHEFNFLQFWLARSLATAIGAAVLLVIERAAAAVSERVCAS